MTESSGTRPFPTRSLVWPAVALVPGAGIALMHAFMPLREFVHRSDDAFYYFKVAANFRHDWSWTFDGLHSTNGFQPLWAWVLTAVAVVVGALGLDDPELLARLFVVIAALAYVAAAAVLLWLLNRRVSGWAGVAAAGALLYPLGLVWIRVSGLETSIYWLALISTAAFYLEGFRPRPTPARAAVLGLLLGATALSRLNAGLLVPVLLAAYVLGGPRSEWRGRLRLGAVTAVVVAGVLAPYLLYNLADTGHLLPISGEVKRVESARYLEIHGIDSRVSTEYVDLLREEAEPRLRRLASSRATDGLWVTGARVVFADEDYVGLRWNALTFLVVLVAPALFGARAFARLLAARLRALAALWFVAVFAAVNLAASLFLFPDEIRYALTRWWISESELVLVVLAATIAAAAVEHIWSRVRHLRMAPAVAGVLLAGLVTAHVARFAGEYFDGRSERRDWNPSWNDESYRAAQWLRENVDHQVVVGSWNAGVLGYFAAQPVVNLDGLINNYDLLRFLERGDVETYIRREGITYLSDAGELIERRVGDRLPLVEVYRHWSPVLNDHYRIYRIAAP